MQDKASNIYEPASITNILARITIVTGGLSIAAFFASMFTHNIYLTEIFINIAALSFSTHSLLWIYSIREKFYFFKKFKILYITFHATIVGIAIIAARIDLSSKLGLPADDFPSTLAITSIACYILTAMAITTLIILSAYILAMLVMTAKAILPLTPLALFFPTKSIKQSQKSIFLTSIRALGALALLSLSFAAFQASSEYYETLSRSWVKKIAYYLDYSDNYRYPGLSGIKSIVHNGGIVSVAKVKEDGIIDIQTIEISNRDIKR
ncbi:hypothetical protein [Salinicola socius]|uniref:Uncharacterized protein n=1 Tax=Salinicola socius TaxID=404433 RepID=A0A1Q8SS92_9GAMM|nr:hypothetical protein [Salinicola socius]OLO04294.1 hypothetical protein BTW07_10465 [Salinicola socius]